MRTLRSRRGGGNAANNGSTTTAASSSLVIVEDETATETGRSSSSTSQMTRPREHLQRRAKDKVYADRLAGNARQALVRVAILYCKQTKQHMLHFMSFI